MPRKSLLAQAIEALVTILPSVKDPQHIKPGELIRLLNSTPLGEVLTAPQLRAHRDRGGLRIGDGKTVDLFRYAAWLAAQWTAGGSARATAAAPNGIGEIADAYEIKKERERKRNADASRSGRDLHPLPPVKDPVRRAAAEASLRLFLETYFPERFTLAWSPDHLRVIAKLEAVATEGGRQAFAMPRGSGKTTLCECAAIWAVLTGRRQFVALVGASKEAADEMLDSVRSEFEMNDLLLEDFPEVCVPVRALEGIHNRAKGQHVAGKRTRIRWAGTTLVLPTVAGSQASAAIIRVRGITGRVRGMKFVRPDGSSVRPDLAIIDDPQTDQSAHSPAQVKKRLKIIKSAILRLAGPGKKIAAFVPCTVIAPDDLAAQLLNRDKNPGWHGELTRFLYAMPARMELWDQYAELRRNDLKNDGDGSVATEFYRKNRKAMDEGARVAWPERFEAGEISGIQHAMNLLIDDPETFASEYQNDPLPERPDDLELLTADQIAGKLSGTKRGLIPLACTRLTAFVDVQHKLLYWMVVAWDETFGGVIVDYGTFPDQGRRYFTLREARKTLRTLVKGSSAQAAVLAGLQLLLGPHEQAGLQLLAQKWPREDGGEQRIERLLIDTKDGQMTEALMSFCRTTAHAAVLPSQGKGIGPAEKPMGQYVVKEGERLGTHWLLSRSAKWALRQVTIDTNYWKTFVHERLSASAGDKGCLSLYGREASEHRMLADHLTAEYRERTTHEKSRRVVDVWKVKPGHTENHWLDCLVGAAVAASLQGCSLTGRLPAKPKKKRPPRGGGAQYL